MSVEPLTVSPRHGNGGLHAVKDSTSNIRDRDIPYHEKELPQAKAVMSIAMTDFIAPIKDPLWPKGSNAYATRKTVMASLLNLTVLISNCGQLKTLLRVSLQYPLYNAVYGCIIACILIEILVAIMLLFLGRYNINREDQRKRADLLQNVTLGIVIIVLILNIMITAFGIEELWYVIPVSVPSGHVPVNAPPPTTTPVHSSAADAIFFTSLNNSNRTS